MMPGPLLIKLGLVLNQVDNAFLQPKIAGHAALQAADLASHRGFDISFLGAHCKEHVLMINTQTMTS